MKTIFLTDSDGNSYKVVGEVGDELIIESTKGVSYLINKQNVKIKEDDNHTYNINSKH